MKTRYSKDNIFDLAHAINKKKWNENPDDFKLYLNKYLAGRKPSIYATMKNYAQICDTVLIDQIKPQGTNNPKQMQDIACNQLLGSTADYVDHTHLARILNWKVYYHILQFLDEYKKTPNDFLK